MLVTDQARSCRRASDDSRPLSQPLSSIHDAASKPLTAPAPAPVSTHRWGAAHGSKAGLLPSRHPSPPANPPVPGRSLLRCSQPRRRRPLPFAAAHAPFAAALSCCRVILGMPCVCRVRTGFPALTADGRARRRPPLSARDDARDRPAAECAPVAAGGSAALRNRYRAIGAPRMGPCNYRAGSPAPSHRSRFCTLQSAAGLAQPSRDATGIS